MTYQQESVGGIVVSIAAFQAVDPGSIPGRRIVFWFFFATTIKIIEIISFFTFLLCQQPP